MRDETDGDTRTSFTDSEDKGDRQYVYRAWAYNDRGLSLYSWRGDWAFNGGDPGGDPEPAEYIPPPPAQQQGGETPSNTPPTGLPAISGTPQVDQTLTADTSGVADEGGLNDVTYRYQWVAGGSDISGATGSTYTLTSSEEGQTIRVRVTFTDDSDNQESLTSAATGEVTAKPAALTASLPKSRFQSPRHLGAGDRPQVIVALSLPVASFEKTTPSVSLTGAAVSSVRRHEEDRLENAWIFFLDPDGNDAIVFRLVTGQPCDSGGICTGDGRMLTAAPEPRVLPGPEQQTEPENSAPTGLPTINGTPRVGETLTASTAGIADADGLTGVTFTYQWVSNGGTVATDIAGATNATYTLGAADAGKTLTVRVTFTDDGGTQETLVSAATDPVPLPLTAAFEALPSEHDGSSIFTFRLRFSEDPAVSYTVLRDESFDVTGGTVKQARRVNGRHDLREIHIQPTGNDDVFVRLAGGRACGTTGALCTADQRRLANSVAMRILGPLTGAEADATLSGQDSADVLYGSHGADTLDGGAGDDVLDGGPGTDSLMGGAGADTFVFAPGHGTDTLSDFSPEEEDLDGPHGVFHPHGGHGTEPDRGRDRHRAGPECTPRRDGAPGSDRPGGPGGRGLRAAVAMVAMGVHRAPVGTRRTERRHGQPDLLAGREQSGRRLRRLLRRFVGTRRRALTTSRARPSPSPQTVARAAGPAAQTTARRRTTAPVAREPWASSRVMRAEE